MTTLADPLADPHAAPQRGDDPTEPDHGTDAPTDPDAETHANRAAMAALAGAAQALPKTLDMFGHAYSVADLLACLHTTVIPLVDLLSGLIGYAGDVCPDAQPDVSAAHTLAERLRNRLSAARGHAVFGSNLQAA